MIRVSIDPAIAGDVSLGAAWFDSVSAQTTNPHWGEMQDLADHLRATYQGKQPSEIPGLGAARALYRQFGVDPTRHRPSSEALLRRALKGQELYQINRVVDSINWASLDMLLPIGLYDLDKTQGDLTLRRGHPGESYEGIRRGQINLDSRLVVADALGACGSPTADSLRTSVSPDTTRVIAIIFADALFPAQSLEEGLTRLIDRVLAWCGGHLEQRTVIGAGA